MKENGAKERILNTACDLFYEQGYQATGINQIIAEAGIAKASLYQHFQSKDALLTEYLQRTRVLNHEERMAYINKLAPGKDRLIGLFEYRMLHMEKKNFKGCAFIRIAYELPEISEESMEQIRIHNQTLKTFISEQLQLIKHPFREEDLREMTDMILNLYEGAGMQGYMQKSVKPVEMALKVTKKLLAGLHK
ncbi:TetR/AcrR family transcriptional regulator [Chitinophaga sp. 212800010-3]|jgi:AcrR family transcriptional regulator|uniref:TetR/AcrR family transcriptional regulator n=1 Tax=unclassified Chitinophaga TaxID=2619133 RepID=UPI002DEADEAE|nr:HTH tetR-type domain-containing protein [Chitinophaga sp. 212800010-3]